MKDWVKRKLDKIEELYTEERLNRSKERWRRIWGGEEPLDRYPFTFSGIDIDYYNKVHSPEERLRIFLDEFIIRGRVNDDFIPSFFPGCKQSTIPNIFGAKEIAKINQGGWIDYTCDKIIHEPDDIDRLPEPNIGKGTVAYEWLSMQQYLLEETCGRIPVHVVDMQGPMDVCGQLWGYDKMFVCAYENPDYYHKLLTKVTDAFNLFWNAQKEILGECFVGTHLFAWSWVPGNKRATISIDSLVMLSPDFYEEFYKPYIEKIGQSLGDITVHSCGDFSSVFGKIKNTPFVKGINAGQMDLEKLVAAGLDDSLVAVAFGGMDNINDMFSLVKQHKLRTDITIGGLWPVENEKLKPVTDWTDKDWKEIRGREEKVMEAAAL